MCSFPEPSFLIVPTFILSNNHPDFIPRQLELCLETYAPSQINPGCTTGATSKGGSKGKGKGKGSGGSGPDGPNGINCNGAPGATSKGKGGKGGSGKGSRKNRNRNRQLNNRFLKSGSRSGKGSGKGNGGGGGSFTTFSGGTCLCSCPDPEFTEVRCNKNADSHCVSLREQDDTNTILLRAIVPFFRLTIAGLNSVLKSIAATKVSSHSTATSS